MKETGIRAGPYHIHLFFWCVQVHRLTFADMRNPQIENDSTYLIEYHKRIIINRQKRRGFPGDPALFADAAGDTTINTGM